MLEQMSFRSVHFQIGCFETIEDRRQTFQALFKRIAEHDDVIKVDQTNFPRQSREHEIHQPLEQGWRVGQSETENLESKGTSSRDEGGLVAVAFIYFRLPIRASKINC